MKQNSKKGNKAWLLIFLCWLVYAFSYLGKVNYSANITQIIDFYGVTKAQAGMAPTFFFFAYGVGQVINGLFCKKYNIKWVIFGSLMVSAAINLAIALGASFSLIKWLWLANGFVLAVLWPTIVRLLAEALPQSSLGTSSVIMGTTVAAGTLIIYALSSVFAAFGRFKLSFYTAAGAVAAVALLWLVLYKRAVALAAGERQSEAAEAAAEAGDDVRGQQWDARLLYASIGALCLCAVGVNLIKDGLTTWVPSILKDEFGLTDSLSILLTLFLPVLAVFGNWAALAMHKKMPDYVHHCAAAFAAIAVFVGVIIGSLSLKMAVVMLVGLVVVNFLASSLNSLITSIFPIFMRGKVNSGLCAGILNGCCYVGSTISSYGLGAIADNFGWSAVFYTMIGFCAVVGVVWVAYGLFKRQRMRAQC